MHRYQIVLVDGSHLLHRVMYAKVANLRTSDGRISGPLFGFLRSLVKIGKEEKPDYVIVLWDKGGSHFRSKLYDDYKKHRLTSSDGQLKYHVYSSSRQVLHDALTSFGILSLMIEGYEADDLIGYFTLISDYQWTIWSEDRDLIQLLSRNCKMYAPIRDRSYEYEDMVKELGVPEDLWACAYILRKSLAGDPSDNIKGIKGVGEVTSKKIVQGIFNDSLSESLCDVVRGNMSLIKRNIKLVDIRYVVSENFQDLKSKVRSYIEDRMNVIRSSYIELHKFLVSYEMMSLLSDSSMLLSLCANKDQLSDLLSVLPCNCDNCIEKLEGMLAKYE